MFTISNLSKQYGTEYALTDITMNIGKGMNFIIGASGSGKTTLLKILCGMEQDFEGNVTYEGQNINGFSDKEKSSLYNSTFGFIWQDFHLLEEASVIENVLQPAYLWHDDMRSTAEQLLKQMKLSDVMNQKVKTLSGGQKQRVAIAREVIKNPKVIFCDEPTSALDTESAKLIMDILRNLSAKRTVIVVTHDTSFITKNDAVFELDKSELISAPDNQKMNKKEKVEIKPSKISVKNAFKMAIRNLKNKPGRFAISVLSVMLAGIFLMTTVSGAISKSSQNEFDKLVATYGEGILDIGLVGSFMNAAGGDNDKPNGDVNQDLSGLYETYQNDKRVEFIVSMQPFENIEVTLDGKKYTVEKTGNSPVLTKLLSGSVPAGDKFQVVIPLKLAEEMGFTAESAIDKEVDFSATVFQWVNDAPLEKPIRVQATICGVADNTVVYDYEGQTYSFSVDDSFFFNKAAIDEIRKQAEISDVTANFTLRAKTPEDLISLKDELNQKGIVPLGRFELVEDIVRLNDQTKEQSSSVNKVIAVLSVFLVVIIFAMTAVLRKREYAIYKISGFHNGHLLKMSAVEMVLVSGATILLMVIGSPFINLMTEKLFAVSVVTAANFGIEILLIVIVSIIAFLAELPAVLTSSVAVMLKAGDKA